MVCHGMNVQFSPALHRLAPSLRYKVWTFSPSRGCSRVYLQVRLPSEQILNWLCTSECPLYSQNKNLQRKAIKRRALGGRHRRCLGHAGSLVRSLITAKHVLFQRHKALSFSFIGKSVWESNREKNFQRFSLMNLSFINDLRKHTPEEPLPLLWHWRICA